MQRHAARATSPRGCATLRRIEANHERARVLDLVERHGWNAMAFQTLEPGYSYFFRGESACVAYVDTGRAWVAAGAPIAAREELGAACADFVSAARAAGRRCCLFGTEERLQRAAGPALRSLRIGAQPVWDPRGWPQILRHAPGLREQLRRARAKGLRVRRLEPHELADPAQRARIERLARRWLARHALAPMSFLVRVEPFAQAGHRALFVAESAGGLEGFAGLIPVPARAGWFLEDLVRDPRAPNGTSELLVDAAMRWAAERDSAWLTLGLAPLSGEVHPLLGLARRCTRRAYDFEGLARFKAKLRPHDWSRLYLAHPPTQGALRSLGDVLCAFADGDLLRFGARTLLHLARGRAPRSAGS